MLKKGTSEYLGFQKIDSPMVFEENMYSGPSSTVRAAGTLLPQISKQNPLKKNKEERQTEIPESIKSFNIEKDIMDQNNIGPLVQMLKALDDKGLLEECMQHYIEIQTSYDKVNQEKG